MKNKFYFIIALISLCVVSETNAQNFLEMRLGYGGADGQSNVANMTFSYARDIGLGLKLKPSIGMFQGGTNNVRLPEVVIEDQFSGVRDILEGKAKPNNLRSTLFGLGVQKSINTDSKQSLNLMLGLKYGVVYREFVSNVRVEDGIAMIGNTYLTDTIFTYEIDLSYAYQIKDHLSVFIDANWIGSATIITFGAGAILHL
jgi:hypothetical protein